MSSTVVEATSLQTVFELAANPPVNPRTPLPSSTPPLVLYIARVPGSQDVFLTPIKPREKVVTAEDVQSSLYYVHINSPGDYVEPPAPPLHRPGSASMAAEATGPRANATYKTKKFPPPLPRRSTPPSTPPYPVSSLPYPVDDALPTSGDRSPSPPRPQHQRIERKPVLNNVANTSPTRKEPQGLDLPTLPRRPLPTPPAEEYVAPDFHPKSIHEENLRLLRRSSHLDENQNPYSRDYATHPETLKQLEMESRPDPGSLTLIRRDPGSRNQWNVASVHDPPVEEVSSSSLLAPTAKRRTKKGGAPLYLDITNTGYSQFTQNRPGTARSGSDSRISTSSRTSSDSSSTDPAPEGVFRRRLYMPGSRYAEHGYGSNGHRKYLSVSAASGESSIRHTMRGERHSVDMGSVGTPTADRRGKGYTFTSPWDGSCEFTTGATGRSLKCRHHLPGGGAGEVSELRFNLPTSSSSTSKPLSEKRSSYFTGKHRHHLGAHSYSSAEDGTNFDDGSSTPSIVVNEDGRIDLSLGQERAGGGFGGKQAKLGKLIIEPEGVKMLDLLVAANIGLWWRAWERL